MRVLLKLVLDCAPDAAWLAIRSPRVFRAVSAPFTTFDSLEPLGFPVVWPEGRHPVTVRAFGLFAIGEQDIDLAFFEGHGAPAGPGSAGPAGSAAGGVRMVRDTGGGTSGTLTSVTKWDHRMAVSEAPGGRTLYRDQLVFEAGVLTIFLWPMYWAFWQWRGIRLRWLARHWG